MQCADPHIGSQQAAPAGLVCAYCLNKRTYFPFLLHLTYEIQKSINIVMLCSSSKLCFISCINIKTEYHCYLLHLSALFMCFKDRKIKHLV